MLLTMGESACWKSPFVSHKARGTARVNASPHRAIGCYCQAASPEGAGSVQPSGAVQSWQDDMFPSVATDIPRRSLKFVHR